MNKVKEELFMGKLVSGMQGKNDNCLSENIISEFIENKLSNIEKEKVLKHLNSCDRCFETYNLTTSIINDMKIIKRKERFRYMSIAASIVVVFFIAIYYSSITKPTAKDFKIPKEESVSNKPYIENLNISKRKKAVKKNKRNEIKKRIKSKSLPRIKKDYLERELKLEERESKKPSPAVASLHKSNSEKKILQPQTEIKQILVKENSKSNRRIVYDKVGGKGFVNDEYSVLIKQGYFYKGKNHFKNLTIKERKVLLKRWKNVLPTLIGAKRQIALETISYLKKKTNL